MGTMMDDETSLYTIETPNGVDKDNTNSQNRMNYPSKNSKKACRYQGRCQGKARASVGLSIAAGVTGLLVLGPLVGVAAGLGTAIATKAASQRCHNRKCKKIQQKEGGESATVVESIDGNHPAPTAPAAPTGTVVTY